MMLKKLSLFTIFYSGLVISGDLIASEQCGEGGMIGLKKCIRMFNDLPGDLGRVLPPPCPETMSVVPAPLPQESISVDKKYPLHMSFGSKGANCSAFIDHVGNKGYGPLGAEIVKYLNESPNRATFFDNSLGGMSNGVNACPNWQNLSKEEKEHFWVWVMASIAHVESTCKDGERNTKATNGVAVGLFQLDERRSARRWRGANCGVENVGRGKENTRCAMDIMEDLLRGKRGQYKGSGELWGRSVNSYWQHMRLRNGGDIARFIKTHPLCNN